MYNLKYIIAIMVYFKRGEFFMLKKKMGILLVGVMILNTSLVAFAEVNTELEKQRKIGNSEVMNFEKGKSSNKVTLANSEKISQDLKYLEICGQTTDLIFDIKEKEDGLNVYYFKYTDGTVETTTVMKNNDGSYELNISQGKISNVLIVDGSNLYLDGEVIEDAKITETIIKEEVDENAIAPIADRDIWTVTYVPYGSRSDYTKSAGVVTNADIQFTRMLENTTIGVLVTILLNKCGLKFGIGSSAVAGAIASEIKDALSGKTYGLSCKNFKYFHKNGWYISSKKMYVTLNNVRWYEAKGFAGKSKVIPAYTCEKLY